MQESQPGKNRSVPEIEIIAPGDTALGEKSDPKIVREIDEEVIEYLKWPVTVIVEKLSKELNRGDYSTIIGDDASGRIPAIMIGTIMQEIYKHKGYPAPVMRFIAGSSGLDLNASYDDVRNKKLDVDEQIEKIKLTVLKSGRDAKKVLIVTDTISSGESISVLMRSLGKAGWSADVATIGVAGSDKARELAYKSWGVRVVAGGDDVPAIYARKELSGVKKDRTKLFAQPYPGVDDDRVRHGRSFAKKLAAKIAEEYRAKTS